jgi:serine/threonine-protein kinase
MSRWREAKEIDPSYSELLQSVLTSLCGTGQHDQAIAGIERGVQRFPNDPMVMGELAYCHAVAGDEARARGLLRDMQAQAGTMYVSPTSRALVHVGLGETDDAFEALEQAFSDRDSRLLTIGLDPSWEPLRGDPRYVDLMDRIGLPRG